MPFKAKSSHAPIYRGRIYLKCMKVELAAGNNNFIHPRKLNKIIRWLHNLLGLAGYTELENILNILVGTLVFGAWSLLGHHV